jgi:glycosyltransferase involved in cell wall biosynthesis
MTRVLHQVINGASAGDAITDQALILQRWLRDLGYVSELYAESIEASMANRAAPVARLRVTRGQRVIWHHSTGSDALAAVVGSGARLWLMHHNVTPPAFYRDSDPAMAATLQRGIDQLDQLRANTIYASADSAFNAAGLRARGFDDPQVLPIVFDATTHAIAPDPATAQRLTTRQPLLLFAGRITPNKRQDDLIRLLHHVRRILPTAALALVGRAWTPTYARWLGTLARGLGLADAVLLPGLTSQANYVAHFRAARAYISMSEHEGFGKPLIESMHHGVPVMAYASEGVAETVGDAAWLFTRKDFETLAEAVALLLDDHALRERLIARGHARAAGFSPVAVRAEFVRQLKAAAA